MEDNVFKTVIWASDGSAAERSLPFAKGIAQSSGARMMVVGSVTNRLLEISPCPVLAVPSKQPHAANS